VPLLNRAADRFQRALDGQPVSDAAIAELVETSRHLVDLGAAGGPSPDPAFVATLRERLMAEAATMPAPSPVATKTAAARRAAGRSAPVVVVVGRGLPRLVAGAAASALLVGGVVGAASRTTVPGQALYPVKGWLDGVQVRLATSDLDRGQTYLSQAQEHISDARDLAEHDGSADNVDIALRSAIASVRDGQRSLDTAYATTGNPQALIAMRDFTARALPQIEVLRTDVPAQSLPLVVQLEALLRQGQEVTARRIATCGPACSELTGAFGPASLPSVPTTAVSSTGSSQSPAQQSRQATKTSAKPRATSPRVTVPKGPVGTGGGAPLPSASTGAGGLGGGVGGGGVTAGTGGASVGLPTISATVPVVPSVTASVPLPSVTVGTGGVGATVPGSTVGPVTLPGVTITLP
jgi:hypothetical protein